MPKTKTIAVAKEAKKKMSVKKVSEDKKVSTKKTAPAEGGMKRKIRVKPGTNALREIRRYQKSMSMMLPRAAF